MSKKFRKVLAAILAGTMVLGSGVVANAASGEGEGKGELDIVKNQDIFQVVLPTDAGTQFDYILDPTGVIIDTNHAKYASASFVDDGSTMYFRNKPASGSDIATYSNTSDPIKAYNMSTMEVEIKVEATVATPSGIEMSATSVKNGGAGTGTANTVTPSIYLALKGDGNTGGAIAPKAVATSSIGDASKLYEVVVAEENGSKVYKKQLDATGSDAKEAGADAEYNNVFEAYSFTLTGDCNPEGKWTGVEVEDLPKVSLVWTINKPDGALEVTDGPSVTITPGGVITITGLTPETDPTDMNLIDTEDNNKAYNLTSQASTWTHTGSAADGTIIVKLGRDWFGLAGKVVKIQLDLKDGSQISATTTMGTAPSN